MTARQPKLSWMDRIERAREFGLNWGAALFREGNLPIDGPLPASNDDVSLWSDIKQREHHHFHTAILHGYVAAAAKAGLTTDGIPRRSR